MAAMIRRLALASLVLSLALGGCASARPAPSGPASDTPRVRCLSDPGEAGTRPLFFFLCVQSP